MTIKFNFNAAELKANTTADAEADKKPGGKFFNQAGEYDVTLEVIKAEPKAEPNSHWTGLQIECKDADERKIKFFIDCPTTSVLTNIVNGEEKYYAYSSLKRFLVGCGLAENVGDIKSENIADLIPLVFGDYKKTFNGKEATVTLKWKKNSVHMELQEGFFVLVDHEGKHVEGIEKLKAQEKVDGEIVEADDTYSFKDAATTMQTMAEAEGHKYKGFIDAVALKLKEPVKKKEKSSLF